MLASKNVHIRDPICGSISLSRKELELIDEPAFQRLRNIKQLGFADLAFPGATHSRYSHSLGAMHLASRVFDRIFREGSLEESVRLRFRQATRLAMLTHDLGHAPLSHTTEMLMPNLEQLCLPEPFQKGEKKRQATHEDFTLKFILDSPLTRIIERLFKDEGISPAHIASLIYEPNTSSQFTYQGSDFTPILRQIVTSECDADRMDYLQRDSFYCGVNYGKFDTDWLIDNLLPIEEGGKVFMGINSKAIFSFEDFLLSRYHMFASVYLHHTPVIFEKMLEEFFKECSSEFTLPHDIESYAQTDDIDLWHILRSSKNIWARRIVERRPFFLLDEHKHELNLDNKNEFDHLALAEKLKQNNIRSFCIRSTSTLSKYYGKGTIPLFVRTGAGQKHQLEDYTPLYGRYSSPSKTNRIFVDPKDKDHARSLMRSLL